MSGCYVLCMHILFIYKSFLHVHTWGIAYICIIFCVKFKLNTFSSVTSKRSSWCLTKIDFCFSPVEAPPKPKAPAPEPKWSDVPSNINHLNQDNYNTFLQEKSNVLVMYYAPWCGHCKQAKPAYQEVADTLKASTDTFLAAIDCTSTGGMEK